MTKSTTCIMEGALARRLRAARPARRTSARFRLDPDHGVMVLNGESSLGAWRWTGIGFQFKQSGHEEVRFVAQTILGAAAFTETLLE